MGASLMDLLANYSPTRFAAQNQTAEAQAQNASLLPAQTQAQTQQTQLQNQEIQRQLNDDKIWRQTVGTIDWSQPDALNQLNTGLIRGGMSGRGVIQAMQGITTLQQNMLKLPKDQLDLQAAQHKAAAAPFEGYTNANDPTMWPQTRAAMVKVEPDLDQSLPQQAPTAREIASIQGHLEMTEHLAKLAQEKAQAAQEAAAAQASTANAAKANEEAATSKRGRGAQELQAAMDPTGMADPTEYARIQQAYPELHLPAQQSPGTNQSTIRSTVPTEKQPQYGIEQQKLNAMLQAANAPGAGRYDFIDQQISPTNYQDLNQGARAAYDSMLKAGASPEDAVKAVAPFVAHAAQRENETDPKVLAARRESAVLQAKALREGDMPAFAKVPPALAQYTATEAGKYDVAYATAKAASDSMQDFIDMAESGNKAAAANIPLAGVLQINTANGTKRINRTEIDQYQGAGSLFDQIAGKLGKLKSGQPIPTDVLEDMRQLASAVGERAWTEYNDKLTSLQKRTGYTGGPTNERPRTAKPAAPPPKIYTQADVEAAVKATPGLTEEQAESAFKAKGWVKK